MWGMAQHGGGFNKGPVDLETKLLHLLQADLDDNKLYVATGAGDIMSLFTGVARKERDLICVLPSLLFDGPSKLEQFLSTSGDKFLSSRLIKVVGCMLYESDGDAGS